MTNHLLGVSACILGALVLSSPHAKAADPAPNPGSDAKNAFWDHFGVGLIVCRDTGAHQPIKSGTIVNGIVRVDEVDDVKYGLGVEAHVFLTEVPINANSSDYLPKKFAVGPYISVLPGTNDPFDVIGFGLIFGLQSRGNSWFNLGVGAYIDPHSTVLADGFTDGKPPPPGETTVRTKTITQYGIQAVLSFGLKF